MDSAAVAAVAEVAQAAAASPAASAATDSASWAAASWQPLPPQLEGLELVEDVSRAMKMFSGLISKWTRFLEWMYLRVKKRLVD